MGEMSAVMYYVGSGWARDLPLLEQQHAVGHVLFVRSLLRQGLARLAGPFARLDERIEGDLVGMVLLEATVAEALELVAGDPAVQHGLLIPHGLVFHPVA